MIELFYQTHLAKLSISIEAFMKILCTYHKISIFIFTLLYTTDHVCSLDAASTVIQNLRRYL